MFCVCATAWTKGNTNLLPSALPDFARWRTNSLNRLRHISDRWRLLHVLSGFGSLVPKMVEESKTILLDLVRNHLNKAVQKDDTDAVLRFTMLFLPLERREEGCQLFSGYLRTRVARTGHEAYQKLSAALESRSAASPFVGHLSDLFRFVAVAVDSHQQVWTPSCVPSIQKFQTAGLRGCIWQRCCFGHDAAPAQ